MIYVKFFSTYVNNKVFNDTIIKVFSIKNHQYKNIIFVNDESYTHAVIYSNSGTYHKNDIKKIDKKNIIMLSTEPKCLLSIDYQWVKENVRQFNIGCGGIQPPCYEYFSFQHFTPYRGLKKFKDKDNFMSIVLSDKINLIGHKYRHKLVRKILVNNLQIDIFGNGSSCYGNDKRIKGIFENIEPYFNYKFTISIENSEGNYYITEKFMNPITQNCIPIYWGSSKGAKEIFGNNSFVPLNGNIIDDVKLLINMINNKNVYNDFYSKYLENTKNELFHGKGYLPKYLNNFFEC